MVLKFVPAVATAVVLVSAGLALAATASATTLETNGVKQSAEVELLASLRSGTSTTVKDTAGTFANTCMASTIRGKDSTSKTGATVSGPVSTLSFSTCTHEKVVIDALGTFDIEWIKNTTNGTLILSGAQITLPATILGSTVTVTCNLVETDIGTLTGVASGSAPIDVNAVLNCGTLLPSAKWEGTYTATTSTGGGHAIGVVG